MTKTPRYRMFNGKQYKFWIRRLKKRLAKSDAESLRKEGWNARVVKDGLYWVVYRRKK